MNFDRIESSNFLIYATKTYDAVQAADIEEFNLDLRRFSSIKRILLRCERNSGEVNIRMILNHVIIVSNLFGVEATPKLLFFYCPKSTHPMLKSIFDFLGILPIHSNESDLTAYSCDARMTKSLMEL